jgi:hypothetical protein
VCDLNASVVGCECGRLRLHVDSHG